MSTDNDYLAKFREALADVIATSGDVISLKMAKQIALHNLAISDYAAYNEYMLHYANN